MIELIQNGVTSCVTGYHNANQIVDGNGNPIKTVTVTSNGTSEIVYDTTTAWSFGEGNQCWECRCVLWGSGHFDTSESNRPVDGFDVGLVVCVSNPDCACFNWEGTYYDPDGGYDSWCLDWSKLCASQINGFAWNSSVYTYVDTRKWYIIGNKLIGSCPSQYGCILATAINPNGEVRCFSGIVSTCVWVNDIMRYVPAKFDDIVRGYGTIHVCPESVLSSYRNFASEGTHTTNCYYCYWAYGNGNCCIGYDAFAVPDIGFMTKKTVTGTSCVVCDLQSRLDCSYTGNRFCAAEGSLWYCPGCIQIYALDQGSAHWKGAFGGI